MLGRDCWLDAVTKVSLRRLHLSRDVAKGLEQALVHLQKGWRGPEVDEGPWCGGAARGPVWPACFARIPLGCQRN